MSSLSRAVRARAGSQPAFQLSTLCSFRLATSLHQSALSSPTYLSCCPVSGPQCYRLLTWRFVASCTTLRTIVCSIRGRVALWLLSPRTQCLLTSPPRARRPLRCHPPHQPSPVDPPVTARPPGHNRMRLQMLPVQALTRKSAPGSRHQAHGQPRLTPAAGPLPSRLPHQSTQVEPPKDQHQMEEPYVHYQLSSLFVCRTRELQSSST